MSNNLGDSEELEAFGWPPLLSTARAAAYTGQSKWALCRAVRSGALKLAGKRGRTFIFRRAELDQWLTGAAADPSAPLATVTPIDVARRAPIGASLAHARSNSGRSDES